MNYVAETISGTKYISVPAAQEESGLLKEELERAMALGFVTAIEVGTTKFIERSSLNKYVEVQNEKETFLVSDPASWAETAVPQKEKTMISESLSRELAIQKREPLVPAVIAAALAIVALMLAMPLPDDLTETRAAAVEVFAPEEVRSYVADLTDRVYEAIKDFGRNLR